MALKYGAIKQIERITRHAVILSHWLIREEIRCPSPSHIIQSGAKPQYWLSRIRIYTYAVSAAQHHKRFQ